jgi:F-type H+-transporting ATPase subunit delta
MAEKDLRASKRYASALFATAQKQNKIDTVEADFTTVIELMQSTPLFRQMWESPLVPAGRKRDLISRILETLIDPLTLAFLRLLVDKRREVILDTVQFEMRQLSDSSRHLVRAEAIFATPPTAAEQEALVKSLELRTGDHVDLTVSVDSAILGGIIVRMQDTILDGSVRGTLERMREQLLQEA